MRKRFELLDNGKNFIEIQDNSVEDMVITEDNIEDVLNKYHENDRHWQLKCSQIYDISVLASKTADTLSKENINLLQSQNQKAIECLEKIKEKAILFCVNDEPNFTGHYVSIKEINNQIAELRGKENE